MQQIVLGTCRALPLVGRVQAGFPSPATEALSDTITLHEYLVDHMASSEILPVPDDVMAGAGILKGDMAIIEKRSARAGEIVLAEVDGEMALRTLKRGPEGFWLEAASPDEPPIAKGTEMRVLGVLTGLARRI